MPPLQPSPYRQLGSGGQQPVRIQMILGLVVGLVLVAVPLYLWRRPDATPGRLPEAATASALVPRDGSAPYVPLVDASAAGPRPRLEPFKTIRCTDPGPGRTPPERCDHVTFFEDALTRAVRDNALCAPSTKTGATVSFVLQLDFRKQEARLSPGKSTNVPKDRVKELFRCVEKAMPTPDWAAIPHQHSRYVVNLMVTYPPSATF